MNSVQLICEENKCCGCGICAAICPMKAIAMGVSESGKSEPVISAVCVSCGKCLEICPQNAEQKAKFASVEREATASYKTCKLVRSKDTEILANATSGGFVTTLVMWLLEKGVYTTAFLVEENYYGRQLQTVPVKGGEELTRTQKSRYVQIGHTDEVAYILSHKDEKVILVGTPCYFHGFAHIVEKYGLNRENYLLVGLFCDKTMTTHVWEYFDEQFADGKLKGMHFRSKKEAGWPGDMQLFFKDGSEKGVSRKERMEVKEYFMPECCLDCVDKLNSLADFSVGDDYVSKEKDKRGGNSLIIRTDRAADIWENVQGEFEVRECTWEDIAVSQHLETREKILIDNRAEFLKKLQMGAKRQYLEIREEVNLRRKRNSGLLRRVLVKCKRIFK